MSWRIALGLLAVLLLIAAGYTVSALIVRGSHSLLPGNGVRVPGPLSSLPGLETAAEPTTRINILVMGVDHRPGKSNEYLPATPGAPTDPGRSDTMAVVSIDPATKTAALLSIPRDLWLEVPDGRGGWTMDRINEPYHTGEIDKLPGGGGQLASEAITRNFGIPIDYYVDIDFDGFMDLADALGGIDIDVPSQLTATVLPKSDTGAYEYTFFPGEQHLDGELALAYSRFRLNPEGDFGRIARQQAVVLAARQKASSLGWIDHPVDVWKKYNSTLQTNIPSYMLPGLALLGKQVESNQITVRSLGEPGAYREVILPGSGADVLFPEPDAVARIVNETFKNPRFGAATLAQLQRLYPGNSGTGGGSAGALDGRSRGQNRGGRQTSAPSSTISDNRSGPPLLDNGASLPLPVPP